jgi:perosamine synthetase
MGYIAPAGTPISAGLYAGALLRGLTGGGAARDLADALATHAGHSRAWLFSTGRAAMVVGLKAMRALSQDPRRDQVIVAGYTCYSVPASVVMAGLKPRLCDVDPRTLSPDPARLREFDLSRVLCIVTANLYGLPNALAEIETLARDHGVLLLDDAAQALGARYAGRAVGGFGDLGLYSFDKGKNITSLEGGALVASHPALAAKLDELHSALPAASAAHTVKTLAKLVVYALLLNPSLYGIVRRLPFLGLGRTIYEDDFPIRRYSPTLAGFALALYRKLDALTRTRERNATELTAALRGSDLEVIEPLPGSSGGHTRLPALARDPADRAALVAALDAAGIGATVSYPQALCDVPEVIPHLAAEDRDQPGARSVAQRIVTLPVHPHSPPGTAQRIAAVLANRGRPKGLACSA